MLAEEGISTDIQDAPIAFMLYSSDDRLQHYNDTLCEMFPTFEGLDLKGLSRKEVRLLLRDLERASHKGLAKLDETSMGDRLRSAADGVFELAAGRYYVLDDLALPGGMQMTLVRDVTEQKRRREGVGRLQEALTRLTGEEAIYNGKKEEAFGIIAEIVLEALSASRTDIWLMNVDGSALYMQECRWDDRRNHRTNTEIHQSDCPQLFAELHAGKAIVSTELAKDPRLEGLRARGPRDRELQALLIVPVMRGPRVIGGIFVGETRRARPWAQEELSFIQYVADLVVRMLDAHDRQVAEEGLRSFNEVLDVRVRQRTKELEETLETLKMAQSELVRSEKLASLGGLVAGVAHEINTPLGVALTTVTHMDDAALHFEGILESGRIRKADLANFVDTVSESVPLIRRNLDRAAHLIRSFRMVAVDQAMGDQRTLMLGEYLSEIVDSLKPTLRKKGVLVLLECKKEIEIKTVPGDLAHIITNLIMNAALHAFKGQGDKASKVVRVSVKRRMDYVYLDVKDNGRGIPDDIKDQVFEPFFTTARADGGSGLGLNIVYNTVYQKLKGRIEIVDVESGGTCFKIRFPLDQEQSEVSVKSG